MAVLGALVAGLALAALAHGTRLQRARGDQSSEQPPPGSAPVSAHVRRAASAGLDPASPTATRALVALRDGAAIDLNRANAQELELLPGIGPSLARRIVELRLVRGRFGSTDELREVRGIGEHTLQRVRRFLRVDGHAANQAGATAPAQPSNIHTSAKVPTQ